MADHHHKNHEAFVKALMKLETAQKKYIGKPTVEVRTSDLVEVLAYLETEKLIELEHMTELKDKLEALHDFMVDYYACY